jgi:serine/threonine protein kinase
MPAPTTTDELLDLVKKSGVVDEKRLSAYLDKARAANSLPGEVNKVAAILVREGLVTVFQAEHFLQGKWRGFSIGKYKVLDRIGSGGMGSVYLCEHKFMRRLAAVKVLPSSKASDPASLERFYREARAVAALDHPNIVRAYDIDQEGDLHFLVMEFVDGSSLQQVIKANGPMDPVRAAQYMRQAALGLQHAHESAGLVHRDIKPANLIIDRSGLLKILDMGLARFFHDEDDVLSQKFDESVLGTADYLAPEQALDSHNVDIRADIYSLGCTFYFCLTGLTPFTGGTIAQKLLWHQTRQPKAIGTFRSDVFPELLAIIAKMMAKDPAERYESPQQVVDALAPWTQEQNAAPIDKEIPQPSVAAHQLTAAETALPPVLPDAAVEKTRRVENTSNGAQRPLAPAIATAFLEIMEKRPEAEVGTIPVDSARLPYDDEAVHWESLGEQTDDFLAGGDTDPRPESKRRPQLAGQATFKGWKVSKSRWILGGAFTAVLVALLGTLWWANSGATTRDPVPENTVTQPVRLVVARHGGDGTFKTLRDALRRAGPGDHIVVSDEVIEEPVDVLNAKGVTIEAEPGMKVLWQLSKTPGKAKQLLTLSGTEGLHLTGFVFDGDERVDQILLLTGECAGLTLENLELRGFNEAALLVMNCTGKKDQPVSLLDIHAVTKKSVDAALAFRIHPRIISPRINQYFVVRNCRFEGPFRQAIRGADDAELLTDAQFVQNQVPAGMDNSKPIQKSSR